MHDFWEAHESIRELGSIIEEEQICPGVYLLSVRKENEPAAREYYAVTEKAAIPPRAKSYGQKLPGLWLFSMDDGSEAHRIIRFEAAYYRAKHHLPLDEPLRASAFFAAQAFPEYFGAFPVPLHTSRGHTIRHWTLDNGIYWIETDQCEEILAVCYPVWSTELSGLTAGLGEQTGYDRTCGIEKTMGYLFFPMEISCIPLRELLRTRSEWEGTVIDKPALMNAVWDTAPAYAAWVNGQEQSGKNDLFFMLLSEAGAEAEPNISMDEMIKIFPEAGSDFLLLREEIRIYE